jgi:hypothetical protein
MPGSRIFALRHLVYMKSVRLVIWWVTGNKALLKSSAKSFLLYLLSLSIKITKTFLQKFSFRNYPQSLLRNALFYFFSGSWSDGFSDSRPGI